MNRVTAYCVGALMMTTVAGAQTISNPGYFTEVAASGLVEPTSLAFVGPNAFLYCRKGLGHVNYVLNGVSIGTALDVPVASDGEHGMLGIVLDPSFATNQRVYVYYSRSDIDGGAWLDDRVERYVWNGAQLLFDSLIATWPYDATQGNSIYHHGGILRIGLDGKLYVQRGDVGRNVRIEVNNHASLVADAAAICRLELDGSIPADNPFVAQTNASLKRTYVYGFRNGFGMDIDPLTGRLWFTENGPEVYDEINCAVPGMNSGWRKIMGPDVRDATFAANGFVAQNASDLVYLPGAQYVDPVFSWLAPTGVTGICFLSGGKFGVNTNDILVGNSNFGSLHLFDVNGTRDGLTLTGGTADTVADNATERDQYLFGSGFGLITDVLMGPDGYAYAINLIGGTVHRIRPVTEKIAPITATPGPGQILSGNVASLAVADDNRLVMRPGAVLVSSAPPAQLVLEGVSPFTSPSALSFRIESSASISSLVQRVSLFDWIANGYVELDVRTLGIADAGFTTAATLPARFVHGTTRAVKALVTFKPTGAILVYPWQARIDEFTWTITR